MECIVLAIKSYPTIFKGCTYQHNDVLILVQDRCFNLKPAIVYLKEKYNHLEEEYNQYFRNISHIYDKICFGNKYEKISYDYHLYENLKYIQNQFKHLSVIRFRNKFGMTV